MNVVGHKEQNISSSVQSIRQRFQSKKIKFNVTVIEDKFMKVVFARVLGFWKQRGLGNII